MAVEIATAYVSLVPSARGFSAGLDGAIGGSIGALGQKHGELFSGALLGVLKNNAGKIAEVLTIASAIKLGKEIYDLGATFDAAFDQIRVSTGKTGDELKGLEGSFKTVFKSVPASAGDVSDAISTLSVKLGLTGKPLEDLSVQMLNLSHITKTDLKTNLQSASDVFNSFGVVVADQPKKLDELFRTTQLTGVGFSELSAGMARAGPNLLQLGFSFEQASALVGLFSKAGLDVGDALPFMNKAIATAAKEGKNAGDVFKETFDRIKNAPSDTEAAGVAIDVFGGRAGPKMAGLIRQGKLSYDDLAKSIADGTDTINKATAQTNDFSEKWGIFRNQVLVGLEPLATQVFNAVGTAMEKLGPLVGPAIATATEVINGLFREAWQAVNFFVVGFKGAADDVAASGFDATIKNLGATFRELYDWLKVQIPAAIDTLKAAFDTAQTTISTTVGYVVDHQDAFTTIAAGATAFAVALTSIHTAQTGVASLSTAFDSLKAIAAGGPLAIIAALIVAVGVAGFVAYQKFQPFHDAIDAIGRTIRDIAVPAFEGFMAAVGFVRDNAGPAFDAVSGAISGAFGTVKDTITSVADTISTALQPAIEWLGQNVGPTIAEGFGAAEAIFARVRDAIQITADVLSVVLPRAAQVLGVVFGPVLTLLEASFRLIGVAVIAVWDIFVGFLGFVIPIWNTFARIVADVVVAAFEQVKATVEEVLGIFRGFFEIIKGIFSGDWSQVWEGVKQIFSSAWGFIIDTVKNFVTLILQIFTDIDFSGFASAFVNLGLAILRALGNIIVGIFQWVGSVVGIFAGLPSLIVAAIVGFAELLVGAGVALVVGLYNGILSFIPAVIGFFAGLAGSILNWLGSDPVGWLLNAGVSIIQGLLNGIVSIIAAVPSTLGQIPGMAADAVSGAIGWLVGAGSDIIQGLVNGIVSIIGTVFSTIAQVPGMAADAVSGAIGWLVGAGSDIISGLVNGISSIIGSVSSTIGQVPGLAEGAVSGAIGWLVGAGGDVISGFINGIESWIGSVAGHISGIGTTVRTAIGDASGWLYSAGAAVVSGFVDGIRGAIGDAAAAAANLAKSVKDAAFSALKLGSPSKVFMEIGVNVGEGLVLGINSMRGPVGAAAAGLLDMSGPGAGSLNVSGPRAVAGLSASGVGLPALAGVSTSTSVGAVTINAQTNASPDMIARELSWQMRTAGV